MSLISCESGECLVQLDLNTVIAALVFLLALAVQTWGIVRFLISRMDKHREDSQREITAVHDRINLVKDEYVKRTDIDRDLAHISRSLTDLNTSLNTQMTNVANRIDILTSSSKSKD